jgi:hypothetical protein
MTAYVSSRSSKPNLRVCLGILSVAASLEGKMTDTAPPRRPLAPKIYVLTTERFRGITSLTWQPSRGVNVILGDSDVGKTRSSAPLESSQSDDALSYPDYYVRHIEAGFLSRLCLPGGAGMRPDETLLALGMDRRTGLGSHP